MSPRPSPLPCGFSQIPSLSLIRSFRFSGGIVRVFHAARRNFWACSGLMASWSRIGGRVSGQRPSVPARPCQLPHRFTTSTSVSFLFPPRSPRPPPLLSLVLRQRPSDAPPSLASGRASRRSYSTRRCRCHRPNSAMAALSSPLREKHVPIACSCVNIRVGPSWYLWSIT